MPSIELNQFDLDATRQIVQTVREFRSELKGKPRGQDEAFKDVLRIRVAKIDTDYTNAGNRFRVILGNADWDEDDTQPITFTPYSSDDVDKRMVYGFEGAPAPSAEGLILIGLTGGKWYPISGGADWLEAKVESPQGVSRGGSGLVRVFQNGVASNRTETALLPWLTTQAVSYGKEVMIQWDRYRRRWCIRLAQCE